MNIPSPRRRALGPRGGGRVHVIFRPEQASLESRPLPNHTEIVAERGEGPCTGTGASCRSAFQT
jgi:hypothetical protein